MFYIVFISFQAFVAGSIKKLTSFPGNSIILPIEDGTHTDDVKRVKPDYRKPATVTFIISIALASQIMIAYLNRLTGLLIIARIHYP